MYHNQLYIMMLVISKLFCKSYLLVGLIDTANHYLHTSPHWLCNRNSKGTYNLHFNNMHHTIFYAISNKMIELIYWEMVLFQLQILIYKI